MQLDVAVQLECALFAVFHRFDDLRFVIVRIESQRDIRDDTREHGHDDANRPQTVLEIFIHIITWRV